MLPTALHSPVHWFEKGSFFNLGFWRGGGRGIPQFMGRGRGGPPNRGGNRGGAQASAGTAPRARGRGQVQKGELQSNLINSKS